MRDAPPHEASLIRRRRRVVHLPDHDDVIDSMPAELRVRVAQTWQRRAHQELRVAAAFSVLCRDLLEVGGDPELLAVVSRAVNDEVRHAEVCRTLASRYASVDVPWPGEVVREPIYATSDARLRAAFHVVSTCCVTESIASCFLETSLANARAPSARAAVGELLADEVLHARAGWTFLARQSPLLQKAVEADLLMIIEPVVRGWWDEGGITLPEDAEPHGIPSLATTRECTLRAMREVVLPGFVALGFDVGPTEAWLSGFDLEARDGSWRPAARAEGRDRAAAEISRSADGPAEADVFRTLGATGLRVHPLCLGGNVFGWTADESQSFAVLDAYAEAGGNFIDTSDVYSSWVAGNEGGESETIIGRWMASRKNRARLVIATNVGMHPRYRGLSARNVRAAAEASLKRLGVEWIDLYCAHQDDERTPFRETMCAFDDLVRVGKVRHVGASNYSAPRLSEACAVARREGVGAFAVLQPKYNVMDRGKYEGELHASCEAHGIACVPHSSLAKGFLTGKYRGGQPVSSRRAEGANAYAGPRGDRVLAALDAIAKSRGTSVAAVTLRWLAEQPTVVSVIASARTPAQLEELLPMATLKLSAEELKSVTRVSA